MKKIFVYNKKAELIDYHFVNSVDSIIGIYVNQDVIFSEIEYVNPVIDNGEIREMTINELKLNGLLALEAGEKIANGEITLIISPGEFFSWNYESLEWQYDESKKKMRINSIIQETYNEIVATYPEWKQLNIIRTKDYSDESFIEYEKMVLFIDEIRARSDYEILTLDVIK